MPTPLHAQISRLVAELLSEHDPTFAFTALQFGLNTRASLHVDPNNMGPSYNLVIGPYTGGILWQMDTDDRGKLVQRTFPPGRWNFTNGRPSDILQAVYVKA